MDKLCKDNLICCADNCRRCANLIYEQYLKAQEIIEELEDKLDAIEANDY